MVQSPPIPVLDRKNINANSNYTTVADMAQAQFDSASFTLKRSGRVVRKIDASPPMGMRCWKPLQSRQTFGCENEQTIEQALAGRQLIAETIYIAKPIIHLTSMACFGTRTWKPWLLSLILDLSR
ncbi:hypothetical protein NQ314_015119 [Rhamnusium bicolor]|uniref:Peroxisomal membrane protein PEX16 n=1 Tax=Rhamnusium bicolor TaxID=1586634 RepID=A0AAV8WZV2_9CUCU|nr:hypothetical protein NQ314_015119 [Rhamnusium bicolor]